MNAFRRCVFTLMTVSFISTPVMAGTAVTSGQTAVTIQPLQQVQGEPQAWLHVGVESLSGDNTYQIGLPVTDSFGNVYQGHFPISELKFPLDAVFGVIKLNTVIKDRFVLDVVFKKNLTEPDDYLEDRDWITESNPGQLDIYSDSEVTRFDGLVLDIDFGYKVLCGEKGWVAAGAGFMYQDFEWDTAGIRQWSPSGYPDFDYVGDGSLSILYEVNYKMPYLFLSGQLDLNPNFRINGRFAYAPWVDAEDRDQHLLRYKENRGSYDGYAFMVAADAMYDFTQHWFMTGGVSHTSIDVDGEQNSSFFGYHDHTIQAEMESRQTAIYLTAGYRFGPFSGN